MYHVIYVISHHLSPHKKIPFQLVPSRIAHQALLGVVGSIIFSYISLYLILPSLLFLLFVGFLEKLLFASSC